MNLEKKQKLKKTLGLAAWMALGICCMVLLVAAVSKKNADVCKNVEVKIIGVKTNFFVDEKAVLALFNKIHFGAIKGRRLQDFKLAEMEFALERNAWIKNAELYFDNNDVLQVKVYEREPVARIFATNGSSFYLDSSLTKLPLSDGYSARVPIFTGYVAPLNKARKADSLLLKNISDISSYILADKFWMAQVDQVDISSGGIFELTPKIGNQAIYFGSAENYQSKFENLLLFYQQVLNKAGFDKYRSLNLSFYNQVVAVKRNAEDIKQDSLRTFQLMKDIALKAEKEREDSTNNIQLEQKDDNLIPLARPSDDEVAGLSETPNEILTAPVVTLPKSVPATNIAEEPKPVALKKNNTSPIKPQTQKRIINAPFIKKTKPAAVKKSPVKNKTIVKPKAVMKPANDY